MPVAPPREPPSIQAFVLRGVFDAHDLALLVATIRQIDDRHPERLYEFVAVDAGPSGLETAKVILRGALPERSDRTTTGATIRRTIRRPGGG